MRKYVEREMTRIMMATVPHVTAWAGHTKYHADGFLFDWVYLKTQATKFLKAQVYEITVDRCTPV